jgi:hypothetical protein
MVDGRASAGAVGVAPVLWSRSALVGAVVLSEYLDRRTPASWLFVSVMTCRTGG